MRILVLSDSDYLLGLLKGYCLYAGCCEVKTIDDCDSFFNAINNKPPLLVFIDMAKVPKLLGMAEWRAAQRIIKENHIMLCGFGMQSFDNEDIQSNSVFEKIFSEPFSWDEILSFLQERLVENKLLMKERRYFGRRNGTDRRKFLTQKHITPPFSVVRSGNRSDKQQNSKENFMMGALHIDRSAKVISINDTPADLSPKEFAIIDVLASHPGYVVKTEEILLKVWPEDDKATKADVYQYVHMLRKKIEADPTKPQLIVTVKGFGYKLCLEN